MKLQLPKEPEPVPGRVVTGTAMRLIMPTRVSTEFTAQPLTYFVRSLGLESSFHSRLARSTKLSKINHELRLSGSFSILDLSASADLSSKLAVSLWPQPLETNLLTIARFAAARQLTFHTLLTLLIPLRPSTKEHCSTLPTASGIVWHKALLPALRVLWPITNCQLLIASSQHNRCLSSQERPYPINKRSLWRSFNPSETQGSRILPRRLCLGAFW